MKRANRSPIGPLVGVVFFALSVSLTLFLRPPQIASIAVAPPAMETIHQDPIILTVVNQDGGMVCNQDEYLQLRVYLSGHIEADTFDDTQSCQPKRRTAMLDEVRLANLRRVLEQRDLLKCKDEYPQFAIYTDTYTHSTITFKIGNENKSIGLTNPDWRHPRNAAEYPKALLELLREVDEIRDHFKLR
jgi:hypothetical protein